ncbi:response regulator [Spirosoma flavum]|uniref:Response regulator n=1 Tax=Spirosoma flavum TaxID=2048557 RepID=A0ABW6AL52_9BACT
MRPKFLILVVDDDLLLMEILIRASRSSFPEATFVQAYSSSGALTYINNLDGYGPKIVLLDINLQDMMTGFGLLALLHTHPKARLLPVVMFTISQLLRDIQTAYSFGASSFTVKPFTYEEWKTYLSHLRLYWFQTVTLPKVSFHKLN